MGALREQECGARVAKIVEADIREPRPLEQGLEGAIAEVEGLMRVPLSVAKTRPPMDSSIGSPAYSEEAEAPMSASREYYACSRISIRRHNILCLALCDWPL